MGVFVLIIGDVRRIGRSGVLTLRKYLEKAGIGEGDIVEIIAEDGKIIIRKLRIVED